MLTSRGSSPSVSARKPAAAANENDAFAIARSLFSGHRADRGQKLTEVGYAAVVVGVVLGFILGAADHDVQITSYGQHDAGFNRMLAVVTFAAFFVGGCVLIAGGSILDTLLAHAED